MSTDNSRFGFVAIAGAPNVGKSTLLNAMIGQKLAITSRRPQTTRHRILGIRNEDTAQIVFVDTPGLHTDHQKTLNRVINKTAVDSVTDVDVLLFVIDSNGWSRSSETALRFIEDLNVPKILLINKIDRLAKRERLLPIIDDSSNRLKFREIIPVSALKEEGIDTVVAAVIDCLPVGSAGFPQEQITDRSVRFIAAELIREQLFHLLGQELPYESAVEITRFDEADTDRSEIDATIWVEKSGQKAILIGKGGSHIKRIGQQARMQIEQQLDTRVHLQLWVKQRKGWADNLKHLNALGYSE
ncbi:MAG: GTPase Era [Pseudomonadota bacterium]